MDSQWNGGGKDDDAELVYMTMTPMNDTLRYVAALPRDVNRYVRPSTG